MDVHQGRRQGQSEVHGYWVDGSASLLLERFSLIDADADASTLLATTLRLSVSVCGFFRHISYSGNSSISKNTGTGTSVGTLPNSGLKKYS